MKTKIAFMIVLLAVLVAGSAGTAWAQQTPLNTQNHYKCYDIISYDPFDPRWVRLLDQFGLTNAWVIRPLFHCNPVDKNNEGIPYRDIHLLCYEIFDDPYLGVWPLRTFNLNFGWLNIKADRARFLCAPSYKFHLPSTGGDPTGDPGSDGR